MPRPMLMPPRLASALPCTPPPALELDENALAPLNNLADRSPGLARWRSFHAGGKVIPSFVLIGPRGRDLPIRLALIAGLSAGDTVATAALAKLLIELDLASLLAQDYALFGYPQANPHPWDGDGRAFTNDFWRGSIDPAVRFFEQELERNEFDAVVFIRGDQPISGFQIRTCSRLIATEVLWPAVELAQRFVPLASEPIRLWLPSGFEPASIFNTGHLRPRPFCLSLCTPRQQPGENQISAIVFSLKQILQGYRAALRYAERL
ncbi:MAG: hypothetical protein JOY92_10660 [Verrucomicrobia bacterium]|nr:hypothetical protein [Verrucomicrobiota bacterium]